MQGMQNNMAGGGVAAGKKMKTEFVSKKMRKKGKKL